MPKPKKKGKFNEFKGVCKDCDKWKTMRCWENRYNGRDSGPNDWCVSGVDSFSDRQGDKQLELPIEEEVIV